MALTHFTMPDPPSDTYMHGAVKAGADARAPACLLMAIAATAEHENTVTGAAFSTLGGDVVGVSIPANGLKAGDRYRVRAYGVVNDNNSTDTLTIGVYYGSTLLIATGAVDVADADTWSLDVIVSVCTVGATGRVVTMGTLQGPDAVDTVVTHKATIASVDTTAAGVLAVQADWSVAHADNEVDMQFCEIEYLGRAMQYPAPA